jgi:hypothetical protein
MSRCVLLDVLFVKQCEVLTITSQIHSAFVPLPMKSDPHTAVFAKTHIDQGTY